MADNKKWINENTAKIEALAERVEGITLENKAVADELETQSSLLTSLESAVDKLPEPKMDRLQWKCDNLGTLKNEFNGYKGESLDEVLEGLDTSNVTNMYGLFGNCSSLTTIPQLNTSNVTDMGYMFSKCTELTEITQLDTSNVTDITYMFQYCENLTTISGLNLINATSLSGLVLGCELLANLSLKNIKVTLTIGSGINYGQNLTDESLINTAKELWDNTDNALGETRKLAMTASKKVAIQNIYVKLVDVTDDMRAEDEYIDNKKPCVVCESTDEGAMTLREYILSKNWTIA